jgi:hypothetical protein
VRGLDFTSKTVVFFDQAWIDEQARRGFIARKEREGQPVITVTSKARGRYGIPLVDA